MSDFILTYSKIKFYPLEPVKGDIHIEDIAHSLSLMTRANGHCRHFYSVAQHSINCSKEAKSRGYSERLQLGCLLHDASESYISDLTRPVKRNLPEYSAIEEKLQSVIYERFGLGDLSEEERKQIEEVDDTLLHYEFEALMDFPLFDPPPYKAMEHNFSQRDFTNVENEFIYHFNKLINGKKEGLSYVGIDGCRAGWVAVNITSEGFIVELYRSIEEICSKYNDSNCLLIDMPIGLPESINDIRPDTDARKLLIGRTSCIFNTPCRQAVYIDDYQEANLINRDIMGKGLSKQSFSISNNIREIDEFLKRFPEYKERLMESHPEVCFAVLNSAGEKLIEPLYQSKHSEDGLFDRLDVLREYYDRTDEFYSFIYDHPTLGKIMEDCLDALCLAVAGMLGLINGFKSIPEAPMKDRRGLPMRIVYPVV